MIVAIATAVRKDDWIVRIRITAAVAMIATYGVLNFGFVFSKNAGRSLCSDIPNSIRVAARTPTFRLAKIEINAPTVIKAAP